MGVVLKRFETTFSLTRDATATVAEVLLIFDASDADDYNGVHGPSGNERSRPGLGERLLQQHGVQFQARGDRLVVP